MKIVAMPNIMEYFMESFDSARKSTGLYVSKDTEFYIVNMLTEFTDSDKFSKLYKTPATLMVNRVLENPHEKLEISKNMGDITSFMCGFFPEHLEKPIFRYYISLGKAGYSVASRIDERRGKIFDEMKENLPSIVDTLNEIKENKEIITSEDFVDVYNRWIKTGSKRLKRILMENGMVDNEPKFTQ